MLITNKTGQTALNSLRMQDSSETCSKGSTEDSEEFNSECSQVSQLESRLQDMEVIIHGIWSEKYIFLVAIGFT